MCHQAELAKACLSLRNTLEAHSQAFFQKFKFIPEEFPRLDLFSIIMRLSDKYSAIQKILHLFELKGITSVISYQLFFLKSGRKIKASKLSLKKSLKTEMC